MHMSRLHSCLRIRGTVHVHYCTCLCFVRPRIFRDAESSGMFNTNVTRFENFRNGTVSNRSFRRRARLMLAMLMHAAAVLNLPLCDFMSFDISYSSLLCADGIARHHRLPSDRVRPPTGFLADACNVMTVAGLRSYGARRRAQCRPVARRIRPADVRRRRRPMKTLS
jgi:hypothetical protein